MNKKNLYLLIVALTAIMGLNSCMEGGGNSETIGQTPVVISSDYIIGTTMITDYGTFAAPTLKPNYNSGDCLLAGFTVDWDNQPSPSYVTASSINVYDKVGQANIEIKSGGMQDNFIDTMLNVSPISNSLGGKIFFSIEQYAAKNQEYEYELICNSDSIDSKGIVTLYMKSLKTNTSTGTLANVTAGYAFDVSQLISTYGKDTTTNGVNYRFVRYNLKFQSGINKDGKSIYSSYTKNPVTISQSKSQ